jgi:hypothetical protein
LSFRKYINFAPNTGKAGYRGVIQFPWENLVYIYKSISLLASPTPWGKWYTLKPHLQNTIGFVDFELVTKGKGKYGKSKKK